jgi:hypothetical protein
MVIRSQTKMPGKECKSRRVSNHCPNKDSDYADVALSITF